jgi:DsbE subfamily thiol:disulfide oxidoreductase
MNERQLARVAVRMVLLGLVLLVVVLAVAELRSRGTAGIEGIGVADYRAHAETRSEPAPDFSLPVLDGTGSLSLGSFRGQVVVLNFFASWCNPCRLEAPGLRRTSQDYLHEGVRFLGVNERDNDAAGQAFLDEFRLGYPAVSDPSGSLGDDYDLYGMPTTFVIDASGIIRYRFVGYVQEDSLRGALDAVLQGAPA